jgi:hypothetical protein
VRKKIQQIIESEPDKERAAFMVCEYLEDEMDLRGNGWFDDDPEMIDRLKSIRAMRRSGNRV